jgi:hypothetical protein
MLKSIALSSALLLMGGCAFGTTSFYVERDEKGLIRQIEVQDGKEREYVLLELDLESGKAKYVASNVAAFEGQRSAVEGSIKTSENLFSGVLNTVIQGGF